MKKIVLSIVMIALISLLCGCTVITYIPYIGASYEGYTIWEGAQSTKYYASDLQIVYQAVKKACDQMKLEVTVLSASAEAGYALETKGNRPLKITVLPVEKNVTKVIIDIGTLGDKQYAELFYKTIDENIPKKTTTDK